MAAKKGTKLTQWKLANNYIQQISEHMALITEEQLMNRGPMRGLRELRNHLERVLGEAQNSPPLGKADGSIGQVPWIAADNLVEALADLELAIQNWHASNVR